MVDGHPLSCQKSQSTHTQEPGSKAALKCRGVTVDPNVGQPRETQDARVGEAELDSDLEYQDSREDAPRSLATSIAVHWSAPTTQLISLPDLSLHASQDPESVPPVAHQQQNIEDLGESGEIHMGDLLEDANFIKMLPLSIKVPIRLFIYNKRSCRVGILNRHT